MRIVLRLIAHALLFVGTAQTDTAPTVEYSSDLVSYDLSTGEILYGDLMPTVIDMSLRLPSATVLVGLQDGDRLQDIVAVVRKDSVLAEGLEFEAVDLVTSDTPEKYPGIHSAAELTDLGHRAVYPVEELTIDGERYARLLLFPVSVDSMTNLVFNETIELRIRGRSVTNGDLRAPEQVEEEAVSIRRIGISALSGGGTKYLIVTSVSLAPAFERLAEYRTALGVETDIELIETITAKYAGHDDAERLRERLKEYYQAGGQYVLLGGDETVLPVRYTFPFNTSSPPPLDQQQLCDLYFADLTGEWEVDGDGLWGEPFDDHPDQTPELYVGRLPFNDSVEVSNYTEKLIMYETDPGHGDAGYLERAFFFSSDQMRDDNAGAQHGAIASVYPAGFVVDTIAGVEQSRGNDPAPSNPVGGDLRNLLSAGHGIVNIIAHGSASLFCVRTADYNSFPKSYFRAVSTDAVADNLLPSGMPAFYSSLACNGGTFDYDRPPMNATSPMLAQTLLAMRDAGAVGLVGYSRWGWVSSSYLLQQSFFESLFSNPEAPAIEAMYASKAAYSYYRDLIYGQNFLGDPLLRVYTSAPQSMSVEGSITDGRLRVSVTEDNGPIPNCPLTLSLDNEIVEQTTTDALGEATFEHELSLGVEYRVGAVRSGYTTAIQAVGLSIATSVEDDSDGLPGDFELHQNYPNPFNPTTTISFELPSRSTVRLTIYDLLGREVRVLVDEQLTTGGHHIDWDGLTTDGDPVASGMYFYRLIADEYRAVRKMIVVR
jgi:hypothetical protein